MTYCIDIILLIIFNRTEEFAIPVTPEQAEIVSADPKVCELTVLFHQPGRYYITSSTRIYILDPANETLAAVGAKLNEAVETCRGRNEKEIFWKDLLAPLAEKIYVTTDDGSFGTKGFTTTLLPDVLEKEQPAGVVTCGPTIMMKGIAGLVKESGLPCEVSLEKRMACGIGVCLGCTFETTAGTRKKVCVDGPVFPAEEVFA